MKAKTKVSVFKEAGNIKAQISAIKSERSTLQMRTFDRRDAEDFIQSGRLPIEPAEPVRPIRPTVT